MNIKLWWRFEGKYTLSNIKQGIKNLIYWTPIIWKDRNWDDHYIFEILKHKLKAQAKYIGDRDFYTKAQKDARDMRTCVKLIEKIQDEFYEHEYFDYHKERHWFEKCSDMEGYSTWESEQIWENFDKYFKKYPLIYKRVLNGEGIFSLESKKYIAMNIGNINQQRAQDLLFKIMNERIKSWWE
jgi:hypothetical protein